MHPISADGPRHRPLSDCFDYHLIVHCYYGLLLCKREGPSHRFDIASCSPSRHHVSIYRACVRGRLLVSRFGPYRYRLSRLERKQHPHKRNGFGHRPKHSAWIARYQLRQWHIWFPIWHAMDVSMYVLTLSHVAKNNILTTQKAAVCQCHITEQNGLSRVVRYRSSQDGSQDIPVHNFISTWDTATSL